MIFKLAIALALVFSACVHSGQCHLEKYFPYCGNNGVTYGNNYFFNQAVEVNPGLELDHHGRCNEDPATSVCTLEYEPICGSYRVTYPNRCYFDIAASKETSLTIAYEGECNNNIFDQIRNLNPVLVCGSDRRIYGFHSFKKLQLKNPDLKRMIFKYCVSKQENPSIGTYGWIKHPIKV